MVSPICKVSCGLEYHDSDFLNHTSPCYVSGMKRRRTIAPLITPGNSEGAHKRSTWVLGKFYLLVSQAKMTSLLKIEENELG